MPVFLRAASVNNQESYARFQNGVSKGGRTCGADLTVPGTMLLWQQNQVDTGDVEPARMTASGSGWNFEDIDELGFVKGPRSYSMKKGFKTALSMMAAAVLSLSAVSTSTAYAADGDAEYAVVLKVLSSEFWQSMKNGIEQEAEKQGVKVDIFAANTEDDVEGQTVLMENAVSKGYKAIAFAPISSDNLNRAIADATAKGIAIVNIDEVVNLEGLNALGGKVYSLVATDNVDVGNMGASYIVKMLNGKGKVAIIEGKAGTKSGEDRKQGATEAFKAAAPGIELVESQPADWDRTRAYDIATNYLNKYPDLGGIYACNDTMAMGAQAAVNASGRKVFVVGTDGNADAIESVKRGELAATVRQTPDVIGARGVQMMIEAANAKTMPDEPKKEMIKAELITK